MQDKNGTEIKAGDTLFNPHDRDQYHTIIQDGEGRLFLGDLYSPLERYAPQTWWEVVHNSRGTEMDAIATAALKSWRSLQGVLAVLTEEQVEQMLRHEMENSKRSMIVVRLHQRLSALRDARERKDIMIKMGVIEQ